jgi:hypothetical protein
MEQKLLFGEKSNLPRVKWGVMPQVYVDMKLDSYLLVTTTKQAEVSGRGAVEVLLAGCDRASPSCPYPC